MMKNKNVAAFLAFFIGTFGIHRFYLGQIGLGILYCIFASTSLASIIGIGFLPTIGLTTLIGIIDGFALLSMDKDAFDRKYNFKKLNKNKQKTRHYERRRRRDEAMWEQRQRHEEVNRQRHKEKQVERAKRAALTKEKAQYKSEGIKRFKDFDYDGAIAYFKKVLELDPNDVAAHFNIACSYSLNEDVEKALYHLDRAVANGFNAFEKIKTHDKLAYIRVQPEYQLFAENGFRLKNSAATEQEQPVEVKIQELEKPQANLLDSEPDLLDQLQKLGELRDRGLLTEAQFVEEKRSLLRKHT